MKAREKGAEGLSFRFSIATGPFRVLPYSSPVSDLLPPGTKLRLLVAVVVGAGGIVLLHASVPIPAGIDVIRILFWAGITFLLAALQFVCPGA